MVELRHELIMSRGPKVKSRRFASRVKTALFVVALAALALIGTVTGLVAALRAGRVAHAERARAERRFNDVRKLANSFLFEFHDSIANLKGATPARVLVVKRAREYLASLSQDSHGDPELMRELARSYIMLGDIQGVLRSGLIGQSHRKRKCPLAFDKCVEEPPFVEVRPDHWAACWKVV